jgi:hypothetical protein
MINLFLAVYHEHMARTGHDPINCQIDPMCPVCLHLRPVWTDISKEEIEERKPTLPVEPSGIFWAGGVL